MKAPSLPLTALSLLLLSLPAAADDPPASPEPPAVAVPAIPEPPVVAAPAKPDEPGPRITWKDGKTRVEFAKAVLNLTNRVQFRWTEQLPDEVTRLTGTDEGGQALGSFRMRRVKTKLDGWIYTPRLAFELQLNFSELGSTPGNALEDLSLDWDVSGRKTFMVRIGQMKVPFGRQVMTSSMGQQFVDRAVVANEFARGRDQGIEVHGGVLREQFEWRFGVYNGNGQTRTTNDNRRYQYDARLTWQPFGDPRLSEVDFESGEKPLAAVSFSFEKNDAHGATTGVDLQRRVFGLDGVLKYRGLFVTTEIYRRRLTPEGTASFRSDGWFAQAGKLFLARRLEVAGRYGTWDPSELVDSDDRRETGVCLSWYQNRHALKVQGDVRRLTDEAREAHDTEVRIQAQFAF